MGLTAQLIATLDGEQVTGAFMTSVTGPAGNLQAVVAPATDDQLSVVVTASTNINGTPVTASLTVLVDRLLPILETFPEVETILGRLNDVIKQIESLTQQGFDFDALLDGLRDQLQMPLDEGTLGLITRILDAVSGTEERALKSLLDLIAKRAGVELPNLDTYADAVRALDAVARALGGMMCLQSVLDEAARLSRAMAGTIRPGLLTDGLAAIDAALQFGDAPLTDFVETVTAAPNAAAANAAADAVAGVAARFETVQEELAAAMAMGEATLVYLDVAALQAEIDKARGIMRGADLASLRALATKAAPVLQPFVALDLANLPPGNLGALLTRMEAEIADIADRIRAIDPAAFVEPLTDGIRVATTPLREANQLVTEVTIRLRTALEEIRAAVAALPFASVAETLRSFLAPIAQVLDAIGTLVEQIETALKEAAAVTTTALTDIDKALTTLQESVDKMFAEARETVEKASLDQLIGGIAEAIQEFADLLSQAQMQPYFDAAVTAIDAATTVVSAVPFELLPDSMDADVKAAVKPIKETNVDAAEAEIEQNLRIENGRFAIRGDIEQAVEDVRTKYLALLAEVEKRHPRELLEKVDETLQDIGTRVQELSPELTLKPVADALASAKKALEDVDLDEALKPVRDAFKKIEDALDRYSPTKLVTPIEEKIAAARAAVIEKLAIDRWAETLDDVQARGVELLDAIGPDRIRPLLEDAAAEVMELLERFPEVDATRPFGTIVAGLLGSATGLRMYPSSFPAVASWIDGASGSAALAAHTEAIADAFAITRAAVEGIDLATVSVPLIGRMSALRTAVQGLIDALDDASPAKARLSALLPRLDVTARIASLTQNRTRYLASLTAATTAVELLSRTGFSDVDATAASFRASLEPLRPAWEQLQRILAAMGIDPQHLSLASIVQALLREITPERLTDALLPLFDALRDRVTALLTAVVAPLKDAVAEITTLLDAFTLAPLTEAAGGIVAEVKEQIRLLGPDELLREPLASFEELKQTLLTQDPLAAVTIILTNLRDLIARVLQRLSLETLLASPIAIFDHILAELKKLDPGALLDPILDQLDALAAQVDTGLDQTLDKFKELQQALPATA